MKQTFSPLFVALLLVSFPLGQLAPAQSPAQPVPEASSRFQLPPTDDGLPGAGPIDQSQHDLSDWEILADAVNQALGVRGIKRTDEMRRAREEMDSAAYRNMTYYERWIASIETILIEKKILTREEIDRKLAEFDSKWGEP